LFFSSSSFLARILANEKAETLGSFEKEGSAFFGSGGAALFTGSLSALICMVLVAGITAAGTDSVIFALSTIE
jgi:hypothetical protein